MGKISNVWTVVYKEKNEHPVTYSYISEKDATQAMTMVTEADGGETVDEHGRFSGVFELDWCYLLEGKLLQ